MRGGEFSCNCAAPLRRGFRVPAAPCVARPRLCGAAFSAVCEAREGALPIGRDASRLGALAHSSPLRNWVFSRMGMV
jgi:hypothetical protein